MGAREKLNLGYFSGSLLLAAAVGGLAQSWIALFVSLAILLAMNVSANEIRLWKRNARDREIRTHRPR